MRAAACLIAACLLAWAPAARAAEPAGSAGSLEFADSLCSSGDYFRAVSEYKRLLYLEPKGSELARRARLHLGACYGRAGGYQEAADVLGDLARRDVPEAGPALFELGLVYYQAGMPLRAAETFERYRKEFPEGAQAEQALALAGFSLLSAADYGAAGAVFAKLERAAVPCAELLAQAAAEPALPPKSPLAAGLLSAGLPGAGQLYCGRPGRAAASFVLTGLSVFATYAALTNGYEGAGTIAGVVSATIYAGSIRSAVSCAAERNRRARADWLGGLASRCDLDLVPGGVAFGF